MNVLMLLIGSTAALYLGALKYGPKIGKWLRLNDAEPTPAVAKNDGKDFVPTRLHVIFAHHFSAIAGAGPILGPVVAALYGFIPAWLWVVLGGIFIGAVHDFSALFVSVKEGGRSLPDITRKTLGKVGFILFALFTLLMLFLVTSAFLNATATALTSKWPLDKLGLESTQTALRVAANPKTGVLEGVIGGIASTSVIIITLLAPLIGYLIYRRNLNTVAAYFIAAIIAFGSILIGMRYPVSVSVQFWMVVISIYTLFAAGLPVWLILQPRDFINVQILYGGMLALVAGITGFGLKMGAITYPTSSIAEGVAHLGSVWPMLFITIACGAISGFHALVGGGTTSKQVELQSYTRKVGYGAMLLESFLAVLVLLTLCSSLKYIDYLSIVWPDPAAARSNPVLAFALSVGYLLNQAFGLPIYIGSIFGILMVEGFVVTSLDAAIRFIRYILEELWEALLPVVPRIMRNPWFNSTIAVAGMWALAAKNSFTALWPIFGSANQLMAALTLTTISLWLSLRGLKSWFTVLPAAFMTITTVASLLILLFTKYIPQQMWTLAVSSALLLAMAGALAFISVRKGWKMIKRNYEL